MQFELAMWRVWITLNGMKKVPSIFLPAVGVLCICALSSCGWVDATGRENNNVPVTRISFNDQPVDEATKLEEEDDIILQADSTDEDGVVSNYQWSTTPITQGALDVCSAIPDFDMSRAADTLNDACADGVDCAVSIEQLSGSTSGTVEFLVTAPKLRAPVGVSYDLIATDNDGGVGRQRSTFCMIAINEAPEAVDDAFTIVEGLVLNVKSTERNLLSNDRDDDDSSNGELRVLSGPKRLPSAARVFSLRSDGGFYYEPDSTKIPASGIDSFEYFLSDGVYDTSFATVTIQIIKRDNPPTQIDDIPQLILIAGIPFSLDLNEFFEDPDGASLGYALADGALPPSGALTLSADGILSGSAESFDEGSYEFTVLASDGNASVSADIALDIIDNAPVEATAIAAQSASVGEEFTLDVSEYFSDPELQALSYSVDYDDDDAQLSMNAATGVLSGFFTDDDRFTIDVLASDGFNTPSRIRFVVVVDSDNAAPIFRGAIASQTVELGELITPIRGNFSDADDDELDITLLGRLPAGVTLNANGVITGIPEQAGEFEGLRLVATDPSGKFIRSNSFAINVIDPQVPVTQNNAPEYVDDTVFNQGISLGSAMRPVEPQFTDADGDELSYSITGATLPAGVTIDQDTGVVSGTPLSVGWTMGLQVEASDPEGATATSDVFWIRVLVP